MGGHRGLPAGGHRDASQAITESERIAASLREASNAAEYLQLTFGLPQRRTSPPGLGTRATAFEQLWQQFYAAAAARWS